MFRVGDLSSNTWERESRNEGMEQAFVQMKRTDTGAYTDEKKNGRHFKRLLKRRQGQTQVALWKVHGDGTK